MFFVWYIRILLLVISLCGIMLGGVPSSFAYTPAANSPLYTHAHPRLFFTSADIPSLRCKAGISNQGSCATYGSHASQYTLLNARAAYLAPITPALSNTFMEQTALLAFAYQLTGNKAYSTAVINRLAFFASDLGVGGPHRWYYTTEADGGDGQQMLFWMMSYAFAYDWAYDQMTAQQRIDLANFMLGYSKSISTWKRHYTSWANLAMLAFGSPILHMSAIYGEPGVNAADVDTVLTTALDTLNNQYIPARELAAGTTGGFSEGQIYALYADGSVLTWFLDAWRTASAEDKFETNNALRKLPEWYIYTIRPHDSTWDRNIESREYIYTSADRRWLTRLASKYQDGYAQYLVNQMPATSGYTSNYSNYIWTDLLWYDPAQSQLVPSNALPSSQLFGTVGIGGQPGLGWSVMRGGFGSSNDAFATMVAGDHYGAHWHRNQNAFTIHKKASLAIDSGYYAQWDTAGDNHKLKYYYSAISKNTLVFTKPGGGMTEQYIPNGDPFESRKTYSPTTTGGADDSADILAYENFADYTYTYGDATIAYSGGSASGGDKNITQFKRAFVYLKPDLFVVLDRVRVADVNYKKRWLLHSIPEPIINGIFTSGTAPNAYGGTPGYTSVNSNTITITNGTGRLISKTLLPGSVTMTKVGGPDSSGKLNTVNSYDFYVDGTNWPTGGTITAGSEPGAWRMEISPATQQQDDILLHLLYATDSNSSLPGNVRLSAADGNVPTANTVGMHIKDTTNDKVVLFSSSITGAVPTGNISYLYTPNAANTTHYIFDLAPLARYNVSMSQTGGNYTVTVSSGTQYTASANGTLIFNNNQTSDKTPSAPSVLFVN